MRRRVDVFSLSFLDAMTCGLGAVVLMYMIISASVGLRSGRMTGDLRAEATKLDEQVLDEYKNLVELRNSVDETEKERVVTRGLARRVLETLKELEIELATFEESSLATRKHVAQLQTDLKNLEARSLRLKASTSSTETPGDKVRTFVGDGDRQYLTGLKVGGKRIFILVDASASMLDDTIVNIIRRRNMSDAEKLRSKKWRQAVRTVDWLTAQLPPDTQFQIYTFNETSQPVVAGSEGKWLDASDRSLLDAAVASLGRVVPNGGTSLQRGFTAIRAMDPKPDNLLLLVDGLPTQGNAPPRRSTVSGRQRLDLMNQALRVLPGGFPVNTILFPMEGDPMAAAAYWQLALRTGGSFLSPAEDWP